MTKTLKKNSVPFEYPLVLQPEKMSWAPVCTSKWMKIIMYASWDSSEDNNITYIYYTHVHIYVTYLLLLLQHKSVYLYLLIIKNDFLNDDSFIDHIISKLIWATWNAYSIQISWKTVYTYWHSAQWYYFGQTCTVLLCNMWKLSITSHSSHGVCELQKMWSLFESSSWEWNSPLLKNKVRW